jgi:hypothetical protein
MPWSGFDKGMGSLTGGKKNEFISDIRRAAAYAEIGIRPVFPD